MGLLKNLEDRQGSRRTTAKVKNQRKSQSNLQVAKLETLKEFCRRKQIVWMKEKTLLDKATHPKFSFESLFKSFRGKNIVAILIEKSESRQRSEIVLEVVPVSRSLTKGSPQLEAVRSILISRCLQVRIAAGHLFVTL